MIDVFAGLDLWLRGNANAIRVVNGAVSALLGAIVLFRLVRSWKGTPAHIRFMAMGTAALLIALAYGFVEVLAGWQTPLRLTFISIALGLVTFGLLWPRPKGQA